MGFVVTTALADVTNLPLILDFAPILTPWFKLSYFIFWLNFSGLSSHFVIQSRRCLLWQYGAGTSTEANAIFYAQP